MFQVRPLKMLNNKSCVADFRVTDKFAQALWGLAPSEKATDQSEILDLGSHNRLVQHDMCPKVV